MFVVRLVAKIKPLQVLLVPRFVSADRIQKVFHLGGEFVVDQRPEVVFHQPRDAERTPGGNQCGPFLVDVVAPFVGDRADDRRVRTGATDPFFLQRSGQRGFGKSGGRLSRVALGIHRPGPPGIILFGDVGKNRFAVRPDSASGLSLPST